MAEVAMIPRSRVLMLYGLILSLIFMSEVVWAQDPVPFEEPCPSGQAAIDVTVTLTLGSGLSFNWAITNNSDAVGVKAWTWTITGTQGFDTINNAESVQPSIGSNNDGSRSLIVFYTPDSPIAIGATHNRSGDIDGSVDGLSIKLEMVDNSTHDLDLVNNAGTWSGTFVQASTSSNISECKIFNQAMIWVVAGDERKLRWTEWPNDVADMNLSYSIEGHEFPPKVPAVPFMTGEYPEGTALHIWTPNRAGFYYLKIRSCRSDILQDGSVVDSELRPGTTDEWILCSAWAASFDSTYTDQNVYPRGFIMLVRLPAASGGVIE